MDSIVRVSLFPINTRNDIGLQNEQMVQVPPAPGTREMTPAMLLSAIRKQWPSFKLVDDACITVARTTGIAGYAGSTHEQLARDAKLYANDNIQIHVIPMPPKQPSPQKPGALQLESARPYYQYANRLSIPLILTKLKPPYEPPADRNWPPPLPPTSVLLAESGFAHDHALQKLLCPGTKCFWIIPGCILAGPAPTTDAEVRHVLEDAECRVFVDLRAPGEGKGYEEIVRYQYADMVEKGSGKSATFMDRTTSGTELLAARPDAPEFVKSPIPHAGKYADPSACKCDSEMLDDTELSQLAAKLLTRCHREGCKMFIHCSRGHFRTGTLASVIIGLAYELSGSHAMLLFQALHDMAGHVFHRRRARYAAALLGAAASSPTGPSSPSYSEKSFAEQAEGCRALFPEQREQVMRLLAPVRDYVRSSTNSRIARERMDRDEEEEASELKMGSAAAEASAFERAQREERKTIIDIQLAASKIGQAMGLQQERNYGAGADFGAILDSGLAQISNLAGATSTMATGLTRQLTRATREASRSIKVGRVIA